MICHVNLKYGLFVRNSGHRSFPLARVVALQLYQTTYHNLGPFRMLFGRIFEKIVMDILTSKILGGAVTDITKSAFWAPGIGTKSAYLNCLGVLKSQ